MFGLAGALAGHGAGQENVSQGCAGGGKTPERFKNIPKKLGDNAFLEAWLLLSSSPSPPSPISCHFPASLDMLLQQDMTWDFG